MKAAGPTPAGLFNKVVQQHGQRAEGALYWKAYAENKEGQPARALSTCAELRHTFPKSEWLDECGALEIEIRGHSAQPVQPQAEQDEDLKLLALNAIMQQDEARAIAAIQQILNGNGSDKLKERALFVLSQSNSKQAQDLIGQIARGGSNPALQVKAIHVLSIRGKQSVDLLADIYRHSSDDTVKKAILQSYLVTGSPDKLVEAARSESNPQLTRTAAQSLGAMGATAQLQTLYKESKSGGSQGADHQQPDRRRTPKAPKYSVHREPPSRIPTFAAEPSATSGSAEVRTSRRSWSPLTRTTRTRIPKRPPSKPSSWPEMHMTSVALAKGEKDPAMKQKIVQQLSIMRNPEATAYMVEILNK